MRVLQILKELYPHVRVWRNFIAIYTINISRNHLEMEVSFNQIYDWPTCYIYMPSCLHAVQIGHWKYVTFQLYKTIQFQLVALYVQIRMNHWYCYGILLPNLNSPISTTWYQEPLVQLDRSQWEDRVTVATCRISCSSWKICFCCQLSRQRSSFGLLLGTKETQFQNVTFKGKVEICLANQSKISSSSRGVFTVKLQLGQLMDDRIHQFYIEHQNPDNLCKKIILVGQFRRFISLKNSKLLSIHLCFWDWAVKTVPIRVFL